MLRSFAFNVAFYLWTALAAVAGLPVLLASRRAVAGYGRFWEQGIALLLRYVAGITFELRGRERLPAAKQSSANRPRRDNIVAPDS